MKKMAALWFCCFLICVSAVQAGEAADKSNDPWLFKVSYDYFSVESDIKDSPTEVDAYIIDSNLKGSLHGGTFSVGRILSSFKTPATILSEISVRKGDFDGDTYYYIANLDVYTSSVSELKRDDLELKLTYQWNLEDCQPFVGIGYANIESKTTEMLPAIYHWDTTRSRSRFITQSNHIFSAGGGLTCPLWNLGGVNIALKGDAYFLHGDGERTVSGCTGFKSEDTASGYSVKGMFLASYSHLLSNNAYFQIFLNGGWQYHKIGYDEALGEDIFYGPFVRFGISYPF